MCFPFCIWSSWTSAVIRDFKWIILTNRVANACNCLTTIRIHWPWNSGADKSNTAFVANQSRKNNFFSWIVDQRWNWYSQRSSFQSQNDKIVTSYMCCTSQFQFQYKLLELFSFHPRCSSKKTFELTTFSNIVCNLTARKIQICHTNNCEMKYHFTPIETMMMHIEPEQCRTVHSW